jgi:hypothetical protein
MYAGSKIHVKEDLGKGDIYLYVLIHGLCAYRAVQSYYGIDVFLN